MKQEIKHYIAKAKTGVLFIPDMGSISPFVVRGRSLETRKEDALWEINSMRDHDGLERLSKLPRGLGMVFEPVYA